VNVAGAEPELIRDRADEVLRNDDDCGACSQCARFHAPIVKAERASGDSEFAAKRLADRPGINVLLPQNKGRVCGSARCKNFAQRDQRQIGENNVGAELQDARGNASANFDFLRATLDE
jgi:hypothetical protein